MEMSLKKERIFSNGDLLTLFIPLIIEQGLEYLVGLADSLMIAQVGESAVSGVSLVDFIIALVISVFAAIASGGSVIAGQYLGKKDQENAVGAVNQLVKIAFIIGMILTFVIYVLKPFILTRLFGAITPEVARDANKYFMIVMVSVPFLALYNAGAAVFRTSGNSKLPMKIMLYMNSLNVLGNAILIWGFHMGVEGVAIPTLLSRIGAAVIVLTLAGRKNNPLRLRHFLKVKLEWAMTKRILRIGAPFGFENGMFFLGRLLVLSVVSLFGTAAIAANSVGSTIVIFEALPGMAMNLGLSVIIARCVGAGEYDQAKYYQRKVRLWMHGGFFITSTMIIAIMPLLMGAYALSDEATSMIWVIVVSHALMMFLIWPSGYMLPIVFRSAGDARFPMIVGVASMMLCRLVLAYVFAVILNMGMLGTWLAMFMDWIVKTIIYEWHYRKDKWTHYHVI